MSFWHNLFRKLGFLPSSRGTFHLDADLARSIHYLAQQEQRTENEVAIDLINEAMASRHYPDEEVRHWELLSPREREVTGLICLGLTNAEIALQLVISPQTVKAHVRNILWKFEARTKAELRKRLTGWNFNPENRHARGG